MGVQVRVEGGRTARFARRRAEILDIASDEINLNGTRGLTLTAVARALGLDTSSVTYYFRFKDELAAACLQRTLEGLEATALVAADENRPDARVRRFVALIVELHRTQRDPDATRLASLADLSALEDRVRAPLETAYGRLFCSVRGFFQPAVEAGARSRTAIATHVLLSSGLWMSAWIGRYQGTDLDRIGERMSGVFIDGLSVGEPWPVVVEPLEAAEGPKDAQTRFLHAATSLINRIGYRGASVERIAAELGVSVGSFYHHLNGKDELVLACFERSFQVMEHACRRAQEIETSHGGRLGVLISLLLAFQFGAESPLLHTSAYQSLPLELRERMLHRTQALTLHIAGVISDGVADGSLRPVDPMIASHVVVAAIHAAAQLRPWASRRPLEEAVRLYAGALGQGLA